MDSIHRRSFLAAGGAALILSGFILAPIVKALNVIFLGDEYNMRLEEFDRLVAQPLNANRQKVMERVQAFRHLCHLQ